MAEWSKAHAWKVCIRWPLIVGWLSDSFAAGDTQNPLALAMLLTGCTASLWGGIHYLLAARSIRADLEASPSNDPIAA